MAGACAREYPPTILRGLSAVSEGMKIAIPGRLVEDWRPERAEFAPGSKGGAPCGLGSVSETSARPEAEAEEVPLTKETHVATAAGTA